jgi:hypothetical protein
VPGTIRSMTMTLRAKSTSCSRATFSPAANAGAVASARNSSASGDDLMATGPSAAE